MHRHHWSYISFPFFFTCWHCTERDSSESAAWLCTREWKRAGLPLKGFVVTCVKITPPNAREADKKTTEELDENWIRILFWELENGAKSWLFSCTLSLISLIGYIGKMSSSAHEKKKKTLLFYSSICCFLYPWRASNALCSIYSTS